MVRPFFEQLEQRCRTIDSLLCVGLDPHPDDLPKANAKEARDFCLRIIEETGEVAAAFKPNSAFFEIYGAEGIDALKDVIGKAGQLAPVILDAKRGDIGSTALAYAKAVFETLGADAVTVSPYLGKDSIEPFIDDPNNGIFLLCKTSNPGSNDLQDLNIGGKPIHLHVAGLAEQWNKKRNIGLVVGATFPEAMREVRKMAPNLWFLSPGSGVQGGNLGEAVKSGLRQDGLGILVSVSRGISQAKNQAEKAKQLRDEIRSARTKWSTPTKHAFANAELADDLLRLGCVQFGDFTLKSGEHSPVYIDLRRLVGDPRALARVASAYIEKMRGLNFQRVAGIPYAALPIATAICLQANWPLIYPRKEAKGYGTKSAIEGPFEPGETAIVVDDLITTGGSKLEGIEKLKSAGLEVRDVIVLIDRQSGNQDSLANHGLRLHSVFEIKDLLVYWHSTGAISEAQTSKITDFITGK